MSDETWTEVDYMSGLTDEEKRRVVAAQERYNAAAHAMMSGVTMKMNYSPKETSPKHLRVGINSAMADSATIAHLLVKKGVFTWAEYFEELADAMERERNMYESELNVHFGGKPKVTLG